LIPSKEYAKSQILRIKTTEEQDAQVQRFIDRYAEGGSDRPYNLCTYQCSTFVVNALKSAGIEVPAFPSIIPSILYNQLER
jgi:hypothetical protein